MRGKNPVPPSKRGWATSGSGAIGGGDGGGGGGGGSEAGRRRRRAGASRHPGAGAPCRARVRLSSRCPADWTLRWATTWTRILDLCADVNGAPLVRTPPPLLPLTAAPVLGPRAVTLGGGGDYRPVGRRVFSTASVAAPTGRVPGLRGAFIIASTPRALVLVLGTNIAVLLDCSKPSRQCSLPYLLTTLTRGSTVTFGTASVHQIQYG